MKKCISWEPTYVEFDGKSDPQMYRSPRLDWLSTIPSVVMLLAYILICMIFRVWPDNGFLVVMIGLPLANIISTKLVSKDDSVVRLNKTINLYLMFGLVLFCVDIYNENYYGIGAGLMFLGVGLKCWILILKNSKRFNLI